MRIGREELVQAAAPFRSLIHIHTPFFHLPSLEALTLPSHSPRHISESSPEISYSAPNGSPRNPRKRPASTVLDEDTYVAAIEKIVERDFFPDLPKLRDRVDWLEAVRSGDPIQIRDAQLKILERRGGGGAVPPASSHGKIGSTFFSSPTPFDLDKTPAFRSASAGEFSPRAASSGEPADDSVAVVNDSLSLDQFFRRYTSEDNESFSKILGKENTKRRERFGYLRDDEKERARSSEMEKRYRVTDGYGTSGQPLSTLEGWKYTAKNLLMYNPSDQGEAPLTEAERAERIKGLTKEIDRSNTQFHGKFTDVRPKEEDPVAILYTPVAGATPANAAAWPFSGRDAERSKKYDLEDLRKTPNPFYVESTKKSEDGYSFVRTPSPAPGVDESPFITWGEIEGTPLMLEADEMLGGIGNGGDGAHFRIPLPPSRDVKAHALSRDAARKLRESSKMFQKPPLPSPARGGSMSPNVRTLSPAAQKFVRNAISKSSSSVDESLRASYRGASPCIGTPKAGRSSLTRFGLDGSLGSRSPSLIDSISGAGRREPWPWQGEIAVHAGALVPELLRSSAFVSPGRITMLLRSSSTPILNSWIHSSKETSPEPDSMMPVLHRTWSVCHHPSHSLSITALSNSSSPAHEPISSSEKMTRALSENDLRDLSLPPVAHRRKQFARGLNRLSAISLEEAEEGEHRPADSVSSSIDRLFSSSGLDESVDSSGDGRALVGVAAGWKDDSPYMLMFSHSGFGGGGAICGGNGGGRDGGGDGDGSSGFSDSNNHGHESVDAYYRKMIEANPENGLLLGNAKYLKEIRGDLDKAEEYCSRAILANPGEGNVLALYADMRRKAYDPNPSKFDGFGSFYGPLN
ncbi:hypothetical protein ACLOJK_024635 [Asimina triloba]